MGLRDSTGRAVQQRCGMPWQGANHAKNKAAAPRAAQQRLPTPSWRLPAAPPAEATAAGPPT